MSKLRVMFQNQWNYINNLPAWEEKGLDCSAEVRMRGHVRILKELMPDVLGGQEVNHEMQRYLKFYCMEEGLPYTLIWGNYTPLIYRADKLNLLESDYVLYPTYVKEYEGVFNDSFSKSCNLGVFQSKEDGQVFIVATTHLWWRNGTDPTSPHYRAGSDQVRAMQVRMADEMISKYQKKYGNCPVIFGGDFNARLHHEALQWALNEGGYTHAHDIAVEYACEKEGYTECHPAGPGTCWNDGTWKDAIDHILVREMPEGSVRRFDRYMPDYYFVLSDHAPSYVDLELEGSKERD